MEEKKKKGQLSSIDLHARTLLQVERIMHKVKVVIAFPYNYSVFLILIVIIRNYEYYGKICVEFMNFWDNNLFSHAILSRPLNLCRKDCKDVFDAMLSSKTNKKPIGERQSIFEQTVGAT